MNFAKFLRTSFVRTPPSDCFFSLSANFEKFVGTPLLYNPLFHVKVAQFQLVDTVKNYFTGAFQAFYTKNRSSHLKAFIYLKSLKITSKEVDS